MRRETAANILSKFGACILGQFFCLQVEGSGPSLVSLQFRTNESCGLLLYQRLSQSSVFALALLNGSLYYYSPTPDGTFVYVINATLADSRWHNVTVAREVNGRFGTHRMSKTYDLF